MLCNVTQHVYLTQGQYSKSYNPYTSAIKQTKVEYIRPLLDVDGR